ncbi:MAG TPA: peptidoglycan editing factor PgeF [Acidobacteriaceae bacterium]|nr:peptidoglycan editing factor PgeF [Acidobacteriaceae bacterium]
MSATSESSSAIREVDQLLASVGLTHGRRKLMAAGFERQARHPKQIPASRRNTAAQKKSGVEVLPSPVLEEIPWLMSGFSTRTGGKSVAYSPGQTTGELNLGFTSSDDRRNVLANRRMFLKRAAGKPDFPLVMLQQIHSSLIRTVTHADAGEVAKHRGDGMMTTEAGILLAIQTADCIPVLIADRKRKVVAAFHAGWRGTLKRIVENGVGRMQLEYGCKPKNLVAAIGPGIGQCCYAVGEEVRSEFDSQFAYADALFRDVYDSDPVKEKYPLLFMTARAPGHSNIGPSLHLDLVEANRRQLQDAGLKPESISVAGHCTRCQHDRFFSYRADHGFTGRMFSVIGIRA